MYSCVVAFQKCPLFPWCALNVFTYKLERFQVIPSYNDNFAIEIIE